MKFSELQKDVKTRLATNAALAGIPTFIEDDPDATPDQIAGYEAEFETAMRAAGGGFAIIILSPACQMLDYAKDAGASLLLLVPIAIVENQEVTRAVTDPAKRTNALNLIQQCIRSLLSAYKFPHEPFGRPEIGKNGLLYYYLMPGRRHGEIAA